MLQRWPIETIDSIVNLLQEVELVNKDIDVMYNRIAGRERINRPIYIDVQND